MKVKINKDPIIEDLKRRGFGQLDKRKEVEKEVEKIVKQKDKEWGNTVKYENNFIVK